MLAINNWRARFRTNDELRGRNDEVKPRISNEGLLERSIPYRRNGHALVPRQLPYVRQDACCT